MPSSSRPAPSRTCPPIGGEAQTRCGHHRPVARTPGVESIAAVWTTPRVRSVDDVLAAPPGPGSRVLVIDAHGHWEAAGTVEFLADRGCSVHVITSRVEVGFGLEATNKVMFHQRAREKGILMSPSTQVHAIDDAGVDVEELLSGARRRSRTST